WFIFPLLFFSFSNSKLPGYILPVLPAVALIAGERLWRIQCDHGTSNWAIRTTAVLCFFFAVGAVGYAWRTRDFPVACAFLMAAPLCVAGAFALWHRKPAASMLLIAGATIVVMIIALHCAAPAVAARESSKQLLPLANGRGYSQTVVYGLQRSARSREFHAA